jgi:LysM repeat protein
MIYANTRFLRSASVVAGFTLSLIALSGAHAQIAERSAAISASVASAAAVGQAGSGPVLNPRHPDTHVVQRGDTLWDIASMFLRDPWYWPEIWQINPQVANPHLIYPGDILSLAYLSDGSPVIQLERGIGGTERLSPRVRSEPLEDAIPTIPFETLRSFLSRPAILDPASFGALPYLFAHPDGLLGSAGRDIYVRGTDAQPGTVFNLVHPGEVLIDPDDGEVIGYQGLYVGQGRISRSGDPATVFLTETAREATIGDYLIPEEGVTPTDFFPRAPQNDIDGRIVSVLDGVSLIGRYQVVVLNRGASHGVAPGHVLSVYQTGELVRDDLQQKRFFADKVRLPDEFAGTTMVFRVFDRIIYALVMEATREFRVLDTVRNPE